MYSLQNIGIKNQTSCKPIFVDKNAMYLNLFF